MSDELTTIPITMSSLEISGLTGKRHNHLVRDVKAMLIGLYGTKGQTFEEWEKDDPNLDHLGKKVTWEKDERDYVSLFHMDKGHTLTLVAGYNVKLRKRIIDRWLALEAALHDEAPAAGNASVRSFSESLRMINAAARVWDNPVLRQLWLNESSLPKVSAMYERDRQFTLFPDEWARHAGAGGPQ